MPVDPGREWRLILSAAQLLTRIPVRVEPYDPDWLPRGARYFPLVGAGIGFAAGAALLLASRLWAAPIPGLVAIAAAMLLTGAFHEDGLADFADAAGGRTREARLAIMRDSRLGTYGVAALGIALALRVAALAVMPPAAAAAGLFAAGAAGRLAAVVAMTALPYAGDPESAKSPHGRGAPRPADVAVAAAFGLAPCLFLSGPAALFGLALGGAAAVAVMARARRTLGGFTGDVLGAAAAACETAFLLGVAARP